MTFCFWIYIGYDFRQFCLQFFESIKIPMKFLYVVPLTTSNLTEGAPFGVHIWLSGNDDIEHKFPCNCNLNISWGYWLWKPCISMGCVPDIQYKILMYYINIVNCDWMKGYFYHHKASLEFHHSPMELLFVKLFHRCLFSNRYAQCNAWTVCFLQIYLYCWCIVFDTWNWLENYFHQNLHCMKYPHSFYLSDQFYSN